MKIEVADEDYGQWLADHLEQLESAAKSCETSRAIAVNNLALMKLDIEKLIANYRARHDELHRGPRSINLESRLAAAGELIRVIDDLKRLAGIE